MSTFVPKLLTTLRSGEYDRRQFARDAAPRRPAASSHRTPELALR